MWLALRACLSTHRGEERWLLAALGTAGMCLCLLWDTDLAEFNPPVLHQALQEMCFTSRGPAGEARTRVRSRGAVRQDPRDVSGTLTGWPEGSHCDPLSLGWRSAEEASCLGVGSRAVRRWPCAPVRNTKERSEAGKRPSPSILQPRLVSSLLPLQISYWDLPWPFVTGQSTLCFSIIHYCFQKTHK